MVAHNCTNLQRFSKDIGFLKVCRGNVLRDQALLNDYTSFIYTGVRLEEHSRMATTAS